MPERVKGMDAAKGGASLVGLSTSPGSGLRCDACHQPIEAKQVECRCSGNDPSGPAMLRFHQWCYYAKVQAGK